MITYNVVMISDLSIVPSFEQVNSEPSSNKTLLIAPRH